MAAGKFITLEGGEGSGKSTQAALLAEDLRQAGQSVLQTREPGGSPGAEEIRNLLVHGAVGRWDPLTEALLHFAARRDHLVRTVWPALDAGRWVISDRFADSTLAYQGYAQGLGATPIERLYELTVGDFHPDLTFVLDLPVERGLARAKERGAGGDRYERMDRGFHERLRQGYLEIAAENTNRCVLIDADRDTEQVHAAIKRSLTERLGIAL